MSQSQNQHQDRGTGWGRDGKGGLNRQSGVRLDVEGMEVVLEQSGLVLGGCWLALVQAKFTFVGREERGTGVDGLVRWP